MNTIKACIFDLDGVIVDTAKYHYQAWNTIAQKLGFEFTWEENEQLKGVSRVDSLDIILQIGNITISQEEKQKYLVEKNEIYLDLIKDMNPSEILPGVQDFLTELKEREIKIALGSASKNARPILKRVGLIDHFEAIVDGNEVVNGKPDPEVFVKGATALGVDCEEAVVFEDSRSGITAANHGGFRSVGVGLPNVLDEAEYVIPGFADVNLNQIVEALGQSKLTEN
jgi:beta-phosphoglucomutase